MSRGTRLSIARTRSHNMHHGQPVFSRRRPLLLLMVILGATAFFFIAINRSRTRAERYERHVAFTLAMVGLGNYAVVHGHYPHAESNESDEPLSSWRFQIVPYLDASMSPPLDTSGSWTEPRFEEWRSSSFPVFCFPMENTPTETNVVAIRGPGTAFDVRQLAGSSMPEDAIVLVEASRTGIHWMQPGDLAPADVRELLSTPDAVTRIQIGLSSRDGYFVAFFDGSVWLLSKSTPAEALWPFLTMDGAAKHDRTAVLSPYRLAAEFVP